MDSSHSDVESAIARVLAAERAAAAAVENCAAQAQLLVEHARTRSRQIADRASRRLQHCIDRINQAATRDTAALDSALPDIPVDPQALVDLQRVVDRIAAELTGASP